MVVGYPRLFDVDGFNACFNLSPTVQTWLNTMGDQLAQTSTGAIADTLNAYPSMAITFVDARAGFAGHAVCEFNGNPEWINGVNAVEQMSSFHPNSNGQREYANLINAAL
jgi:hypothetical protein